MRKRTTSGEGAGLSRNYGQGHRVASRAWTLDVARRPRLVAPSPTTSPSPTRAGVPVPVRTGPALPSRSLSELRREAYSDLAERMRYARETATCR